MTKPIIYAVLGADRVGKSTLINNTQAELANEGVKASVLHFSGPQPHHSSPIEQYITPLEDELCIYPDLILCDRFGAEVCFYEKFRRHNTISEEWARSVESYFADRASDIKVFLVKKNWEWTLPHHTEEILAADPDCTLWWMNMKLQERKEEHERYYEYMTDYLENRSMLKHQVISDSVGNALLDTYRVEKA